VQRKLTRLQLDFTLAQREHSDNDSDEFQLMLASQKSTLYLSQTFSCCLNCLPPSVQLLITDQQTRLHSIVTMSQCQPLSIFYVLLYVSVRRALRQCHITYSQSRRACPFPIRSLIRRSRSVFPSRAALKPIPTDPHTNHGHWHIRFLERISE